MLGLAQIAVKNFNNGMSSHLGGLLLLIFQVSYAPFLSNKRCQIQINPQQA